MPPKDLRRIKASAAAEARRLARFASDPEAPPGEDLRPGRRWRKVKRWFSWKLDLWTKRLERIGKWVTALLVVLGGGVKLYQLMHARTIAPAEEPKTGVASTTIDRVSKPTPPK